MIVRLFISIQLLSLLSATLSCAHKAVRPLASAAAPADNAYMDLKAGGRLRIIVPLLNSGSTQVSTRTVVANGNTMVLSASNLAGYEISNYSIEGRAGGKVKLKFTFAELTQNGKTNRETTAPALPFPLPSGRKHIRLVYLIRSSQADHNMSIASSRNLSALNAFTDQLKTNPAVCHNSPSVACSWVPAGIAVRPD